MKKVLISIFTLIFIISMITVVNAASGSVSAVASSSQITKGNTFTISLAGTSDNPIDGMYTKFSYDTTVLELVSKTPGLNYGDNSSEGEILINNNSTSTSQTSGNLYTLTFKVLDNAKEGDTIINFSESELHLNENGTIGKTTVTINGVTVKIKEDSTIIDKDDNKDNTKKPSNNQGSTNKPDNNSGSSSKPASKDTTKKATKKLPQTGLETGSIIWIAILSVFAVISYVSYKKYRNI